MVQGSLRSREYESDGVQRRIFELRADTVAKLDRAERREEEVTLWVANSQLQRFLAILARPLQMGERDPLGGKDRQKNDK